MANTGWTVSFSFPGLSAGKRALDEVGVKEGQK
jgi:hypothetical protein